MISLVTANIASGTNEAANRAERLDTTTFGADSHTIRMIEGVLLRSAFSRARHLGLGSLVPWAIAVSTEFMVCRLLVAIQLELPFHLADLSVDVLDWLNFGAHLEQTQPRKTLFEYA